MIRYVSHLTIAFVWIVGAVATFTPLAALAQSAVATPYDVITTPIVLTGSQSMVVANANVTISTNVMLSDNAVLTIENSTLAHVSDHAGQYTLRATGNSKVVVRNSTITSSPWINWNFWDNSTFETVDVTNTDSAIWHSFIHQSSATATNVSQFSGTIANAGSVVVDGAARTFVEIVFPPGAIVDEALPGTVGQSAYVFPNQLETGTFPTLQLENVATTQWGITYVPLTNVTIRDTNDLVVTYAVDHTFSDITAEFSGLRAQLYTDQSWTTGNATLRLVNTRTLPWSPIASGSNRLVITDSQLADQQFSFGNAEISISDSSLSFLKGNDSVELTVTRSAVSGDVVATGNSVIRLTDSSVAGRLIEEGEGHVIIQNLLGLGRFFELGQHGQLTSRTADVIAGAGSVKGSYGGTQSYNAFLWTRPDRVPLTPGDRYAVTFSYRILSLPSLGFEVLFLSPTAAQEGNFLPSTIISGTAGSTGTATLTNELGPYSDYKALWNIIGTGAIAVDDIQVRNLDTGQLVASENAECVSTCPFTDDPLQSNVTPIRAEHITELRRRIDFLSQRYGLALPPWIDLGLSGMWVRAAHIIQLRTAITFIYVAAGRTAPTFTDSEIVAGATSIRAVHIAELRAALATIE